MKYFVKAKPRAKKNKLTVIDNDHLIIETTAAPDHGKANTSIIKLIAKYFKISQSKVNIISGLTSKEKIIEIIK
ncbi:MAG: DUF167 domain-containing protein [bacterium]|nr:DUF167 domain-containing protein [bacterium]